MCKNQMPINGPAAFDIEWLILYLEEALLALGLQQCCVIIFLLA